MQEQFAFSRRDAIVSLLATLPCLSQAQSIGYPTKPIKFLVGFAAGGGGDVGARVVADAVTRQIGQSVIVENRPGAGGTVAAGTVARTSADGYMLAVVDPGVAVYGDAMFKGLNFDPAKDLVPVAAIFRTPFVIVGGPAMPRGVSSLKQLLDYAGKNPDTLSVGNSGTGSAGHLAIELLKHRANVDMRSIPYRAGNGAVTDVVGGQLPLAISAKVSTDQLIRTGRITALAVTSKSRVPEYPDVPAVSEFIPGFEASVWASIFAPAGTPPDVVNRLNAEVNKAFRSPELIKKYESVGYEPMPMTADELARFIKAEAAVWQPLIRKLNITAGS